MRYAGGWKEGRPERAGQRFRIPSATAMTIWQASAATERSVRWFRSGPPTGSRCELGLSSNTKEWLATPSARSDGFDNVDGGPDCRVYIQMRGVEQVRIRGRPQ